MRNTVLALLIFLACVTGDVAAAPPKTPPKHVGPGSVAWFDITTTNLGQSKEFYGKLFDWKFTALQGTDQAVEIVARGRAIGTLRGAEGKISAFNGVAYIQVTDILASCAKAKALGGRSRTDFPSTFRTGSEPSPW